MLTEFMGFLTKYGVIGRWRLLGTRYKGKQIEKLKSRYCKEL